MRRRREKRQRRQREKKKKTKKEGDQVAQPIKDICCKAQGTREPTFRGQEPTSRSRPLSPTDVLEHVFMDTQIIHLNIFIETMVRHILVKMF